MEDEIIWLELDVLDLKNKDALNEKDINKIILYLDAIKEDKEDKIKNTKNHK